MKYIRFGNKGFDAVVCLNADIPAGEEIVRAGELPVIAADGAAFRLAEVGIMPDIIIGDMDSIREHGRKADFPSSRIICIPDQDSNDFEKILRYCRDNSLDNLLIIGFHGGELEHTLNNWSVFMRYSRSMNLCVLDLGRYGMALREPARFDFRPGETISLIPQPRAVLATSGFHWELRGEALGLGEREGARNRAERESVTIDVAEGELFIFFDSRLPFAPEFCPAEGD